MHLQIVSFLKRPILRQFGGGLTSQILQSATNMILSMLVARACSKDEYGLYTIAFTTLIILTSFQNALFSSPYQVVVAKKNFQDRILFTSGIALNQIIFFTGLFALALLGYFGYGIIKHTMSSIAFGMIFICTAFTWVTREFVRTLNSSSLNMKALLTGEMTYAIIALTGSLLFWQFHVISSINTLLCLGCGCLFGAVLGIVQSKQHFNFNFTYAKSSLKEISKYSGWAVLGVVIYIIQSQSYIYLLSFLTSLSETAEINAGKMFLMPIGLLIGGINRILIPKGSEIVNKPDGEYRLAKLILYTVCMLLIISIVYCILLGFFYKPVVTLTIGKKYAGIGQYFFLWSAVFLAQVIRYPMAAGLQVLKKFKYTAVTGGICAVVTLAGCFTGFKLWGGKGIVAGLLGGEIIGFLLYIPSFNFKRKRLYDKR